MARIHSLTSPITLSNYPTVRSVILEKMHTGTVFIWLQVLLMVVGWAPVLQAWTRDYFTAAVFEHARLGRAPNVSSEFRIQSNLAIYKKAAGIAKSKGADLILFPEYGIFPAGNRTFLKSFVEHIPDPKKIHVNPCEDASDYSTRPILLALSCMAKENGMVVVANTGDIQPCKGHPKCPEDEVFQFNTNVVFDKDGTLLVRYYKQRLFLELGYDLPQEEQDPTFNTDFGSFATFICFDIIFKYMAEYAQKPGLDSFLLSCMWINSSPLFTSVPFWESWAVGHNATLAVSNLQVPGYSCGGSGMFNSREGTLAYTFNPDGISKLVVSRIPRSSHRRYISFNNKPRITAITENDSTDYKDEGKDMPHKCSVLTLGYTQNFFKDYRCYHVNTTVYTLTKLIGSKGRAEACNNRMCCSVDYSANGMEEDFYLGVFNGTYNPYLQYSWAEENCFLAKCDEFESVPCSVFPMTTKTLFHRVRMTANFSSSVVWPTVAGNKMRPVAKQDWTYDVSQKSPYKAMIEFESLSGKQLLVVGMKGRNFDRDPPYER